ncbi:MAG: bifunctional hydroxymethylpyrimidine kinase/phosphomethylpyrimidine kinase, partial [Proteobacteria bacterium]|nr:bifunctional hydroxymethylpyrimidine kinase/phosphomethylpyrimidine kinase [Pseudomonadota bacterium]
DVVRNVILGLMELEDAVPVVVDPVLLASDGTPLLERRAWPSLRDLVSRAALVTPNLPEAEALAERDVSTRAATEDAARFLVRELGAGAALVKGGHRDGAPDDLLAVRAGDAVELEWLPGERIDIDSVHGTGCALSSAIAALLARGEPLRRAVAGGRVFVSEAIRRSAPASRAGPGGGARFLVYP